MADLGIEEDPWTVATTADPLPQEALGDATLLELGRAPLPPMTEPEAPTQAAPRPAHRPIAEVGFSEPAGGQRSKPPRPASTTAPNLDLETLRDPWTAKSWEELASARRAPSAATWRPPDPARPPVERKMASRADSSPTRAAGAAQPGPARPSGGGAQAERPAPHRPRLGPPSDKPDPPTAPHRHPALADDLFLAGTRPAGPEDAAGPTFILPPETARRLSTGAAKPNARPFDDDADPEASVLGMLVEPVAPDLSDPRTPPPEFTVAAPGELAGLAAEVSVPEHELFAADSMVRRGLAAPSAPHTSSEPESLDLVIEEPLRMAPYQGVELTDSGFEVADPGMLSMPGDAVAPGPLSRPQSALGRPAPIRPPNAMPKNGLASTGTYDGWLHPAHLGPSSQPAPVGRSAAPGDQIRSDRSLDSLDAEDTRAIPKIPAGPRLRVPATWRRAASAAVDAGFVVASAALAGFGPAGLAELGPPDAILLQLMDPATAAWALGGAALAFGVLTGLQAALGRSLGQLSCGLVLVETRTGDRAKAGRALLRALLAVPSVLLLGAGCAWLLVDRRGRTWHELLSGTVLVVAGRDPDTRAPLADRRG